MYSPIRRSLPARSEPDNTFWTASTKGHNGQFGRIEGEHDHQTEMIFVNVLATQIRP